jgi:hypothetical protein
MNASAFVSPSTRQRPLRCGPDMMPTVQRTARRVRPSRVAASDGPAGTGRSAQMSFSSPIVRAA